MERFVDIETLDDVENYLKEASTELSNYMDFFNDEMLAEAAACSHTLTMAIATCDLPDATEGDKRTLEKVMAHMTVDMIAVAVKLGLNPIRIAKEMERVVSRN